MVETVLKNLEKGAEGNKLNSLDSKEKQELQNLSVEAIQKQKADLGNVTFDVGGKNMKLSDIVKSFDTATGTVNGVKVEKRSDLAAAIQVFVLANGKHISVNPIAANNEAKGIDGIVGTNTKSGIDAYKNSVNNKPDKGNDKPSEQNDKLEGNIARLVDAVYTNYVGKYNNPKYNLLKGGSGRDQGTLRSKRIKDNMVTIWYQSAEGKKEGQYIELDANVSKTGKEYSVDKFGKAIENAISKKEAEIKKAEDERIAKEKLDAKQDAIVKAVESFDVTGKFSKKAMAYLREKDFLSASGKYLDFQVAGTGIHFDDKGDLRFKDAFHISKDKINSCYVNGKLNETKFVAILSPYFDKQAEEYFKTKAHNLAQQLNKYTVSSVGAIGTVRQQFNYVEREMKKIGELIEIPQEDSKILKQKKEELKSMNDFMVVKEGMENTLNELIKNWETSKGESYAQSVDALRRFSRLLNEHKRAWNGKDVYAVYNKIPDGQQKYEDLRKRAQAAADKTRQKER